MAIIKKFSPFQNLSSFQVFINDTTPNSQYFKITEFGETFTGGKNGFLIEGSEFLKETTEVKIEILDVENVPIYYEPGDGIPEYYEGTSKLVSVHVYDDTPIGTAKITILGELKNYVDENGAVVPVPDEWKGIYNVKWEKTFQVNKNLSNETRVRFYKRPLVSIEELVKPIFSKSVPTVTDTGTATGESLLPPAGTNLTNYRAGTAYRITRSSGSWDRDVDENQITFSGLGYSANINEVLNDKQVLVDIPYSVNSVVDNFVSQSYSVTYSDFQNEVVGESTLTGSFAKIDIRQLKTFVGDVARVKVFRKSRNAVGDFQFVQESKLESTELLRDITSTSNTEIPYGRFDETNLSTYWITSSDSHPTTIDSSVLSQAVKFDYDSVQGGVQRLITSQSFDISNDVEYTLNFRTLLSGSIDGNKSLKAYFSSSEFTQDFVTVSGSAIYTTRQRVSQNIISQNSGSAYLVFEVQGDDWYLSNVSLKNAQDTSFSPDEFTLIQDIPRKLASETFDFRFEFYDINNNYIPVDVTAVGVFDGGNDFPTSGKLLTFESDRNAFRFSSGSVQAPENQVIKFAITQNNLTGSLTFASSAFDTEGNYLDPSDYSQYPGFLTSVSPAGALLTINNFTGSRTDGNPEPFVGSIVYTASLDSLEEYETVYRLEDGENAPQLIVTANANQFTYEPTELKPKPYPQEIRIRAQRKNLAGLDTPITVNKSNSAGPDLTLVSDSNGIKTYSLSATEFSSSFADTNFDEITYSFTGSDVFGNEQTDEITISKMINFDGVSITLSNEATVFRANGQGVILDNLDSGDGIVEVRIADKEIEHQNGLGKNKFDIISVVASTDLTANSLSPVDNSYGISSMNTDNGNLLLNITYKAGDNATTQSFQKKVNYTKNRIASPSIIIDTTNTTQNVDAKSTGAQLTAFDDSEITIREFYTGSVTTFASSDVSISFNAPVPNTIATDNGDLTISYSNLPDNTNSTQVLFTATVTDSEGQTRTVTDTVSLSKSPAAAPNVEFQVTPNAQTLTSDSVGGSPGSATNLVVTANQGGSSRTLSSLSADATGTGITITSETPATGVIVLDTSEMSVDTATITITATTSNTEGTDITKTLTATISKSKTGTPNVEVAVTPVAQTIDSNSKGNGTTSPQTLTVTALEGGADRFTSIGTLTYSGGLTGTKSGNTITFTDTASDMTSDTETITIPVNYTDGEGTTGTKTVKATISRVRAAAPTTLVSISPQAQTVPSSSQDGIGTPTNLTVSVTEGGQSYTYAASGDSSFQVTSTTHGSIGAGGLIDLSSETIPSTGINGSVGVSYINSESESGTQSLNFNVGVAAQGSDGEPGASGPGIVFRGPWADDITYYDTDDFETRRDAVIHNDIYYATKTNATTNLNKEPGVETAFWEELGEDSFFVAAEIAIFKESYIENTLNIGTDRSGNAHITLTGLNDYPYFSLGQSTQGYGNSGIFIGNDTSLGKKMSLVGTGGSLLWDGANLTTTGTINAKAGNFDGAMTVNGGSMKIGKDADGSGNDGIYINQHNYWYSTGTFKVGSDSNNMTFSGNALTVSGTINAYGGTFDGNINVTGGTISVAGGNIEVNGGAIIGKDNTPQENTIFSLSGTGLYALNADINGKITSTQGNIGGFELANDNLTTANNFKLQAGAAGSQGVFLNNGAVKVTDATNFTTVASVTFPSLSGNVTSTSTNGTANVGSTGTYSIPNIPVSSGNISVTVSAGDYTGAANIRVVVSEPAGNYLNSTLEPGQQVGFPSPQDTTDGRVYSHQITGNLTCTCNGVTQTRSLTTIASPEESINTLMGNQTFNFNNISLASSFTISAALTNLAIVYDKDNFLTGDDLTWSANSPTALNANVEFTALDGGSQFSEMCAGGLQVAATTGQYFKVPTAAGGNAVEIAGTTFIDGALNVDNDIVATGNITAYGTISSDKRLKENLQLLKNPLDGVLKLNGYSFEWNDKQKAHPVGTFDVGVVAQEVQKVLPQTIREMSNGYLGVRYERLIPLLIESIKELNQKVEKLEDELKKIKE